MSAKRELDAVNEQLANLCIDYENVAGGTFGAPRDKVLIKKLSDEIACLEMRRNELRVAVGEAAE